jgi:hypothetical protein
VELMTITLDATWVALASMNQYSIGVMGTITSDWYSKILLSINTRLSQDGLLNSDGSLKTGAELLAAYLVCNIIKNGKYDSIMKSENFEGEYSYTRFDVAVSGITNYMNLYLNELPIWNKGKQPKASIDRTDKSIEFSKLDRGKLPSTTSTEFNL